MDDLVSDRLNTPRAAALIGVSESTLTKWRKAGEGPPYHRRGPRLVYYLRAEVEAWLLACDAKNLLVKDRDVSGGGNELSPE